MARNDARGRRGRKSAVTPDPARAAIGPRDTDRKPTDAELKKLRPTKAEVRALRSEE